MFSVDRVGSSLKSKNLSNAAGDRTDMDGVIMPRNEDVYDIWKYGADETECKMASGLDGNDYIPVNRKRIRNARSLKSDPQLKGVISGILPCHPGASYNPDEVQRMQCINEALMIAKERQKYDDEYRQKLCQSKLSKRKLTYSSSNELLDVTDSDNRDDSSKTSKPKSRLTKTERNKKHRLKVEIAEIQRRKLEKNKLKDIGK